MLVVTMGWTWGRFVLSSQQFRGTGQSPPNTPPARLQDRVSQHNTTPARPRPRPIFWSQTVLVLRLTISSDDIINI